jgi:hypothetical protein
MTLRFMKKNNLEDPRFFQALYTNCSRYNFKVNEKSETEQNVDEAVGKYIHKHLKKFLKK